MTKERASEECSSMTESYEKGYQQGREDKYQEITSEYMLLTEEQVAEIRADAIDELAEDLISNITCDSYKIKEILNKYIKARVETLKEQKNE